jgi:O-antigen/teichoic acid export membrane protein
MVWRLWESPIVHGSFSGMIGNFGATALFMARSILIARSLGSEMFGLMAYALALAMFVAEFIDMRGGDLIIRFVGAAVVKKEPVRAATFFRLGVLVDGAASLVALAVIAGVVIPLAGKHPQHAALQALIRIFMLAVPLRLLKSPFYSLLVALKRFPLMAILQLVTRLVDLGSVLALLPYGAFGVAWSVVFVSGFDLLLTAVISSWVFWRRTGTLQGADYLPAWREFRPFAVYGSLVGSLQALAANLDVVVLGTLRPVAEVGFYSIAQGAAAVLTTAVGPVSQSIHPLMNEAWTLNDRPRVRQLIGRLMTVNGIVSAAAIVFLLSTARWLMTTFYGPTFVPAANVLKLLVIATALRAVMGWMRQLILIAGHPRVDLVGSFIGTGFLLLLLAPFAYWGGAVGLAILMILDTVVTVGAFAWLGSARIRLWDRTPENR